MRFRVDVELKAGAAGWIVSVAQVDDPEHPQEVLHARELRRCGDDEEAYPLPPEQEAKSLPADALQRELCISGDASALLALHESIVDRRPEGDTMKRFGGYLFSTLLGEKVWKEVLTIAGQELIELAIAIDPADRALGKLPWEMMHGPDRFLCQLPGVAILRRVKTDLSPTLRKLSAPPRVLFVVGTDLSDEVIQPGAEYLRLLQSLRNTGMDFYLTTTLLQRATQSRLEATVREFKPDVVHIIAHGWHDPTTEKGYLQLVDENDASQPASVYAGALVELLRTQDDLPLPQALVLNACHTADIGLASVGQISTPLAAELVEKGIPLVVGMGGRVSDQACRLFTRRFYEALLENADVVKATAEGRLAAIRGGQSDPESSVDWTLPTLFITDHPSWIGLELEPPDPDALKWHEAAAEFATGPHPVFCDRLETFEKFDLLTADRKTQKVLTGRPAGIQTLAISVDRSDEAARKTKGNPKERGRLGRSWLLRELAAKAIRDGNLPCLVDPSDQAEEQPNNVTDLLKCFHTAVRATRQRFDLPGPSLPSVRRLLAVHDGEALSDDMDTEILEAAFGHSPHSAQVQAVALRIDLLALLEEARAKRPGARLVLLIDDLHRMGADAVTDLLHGLLHTFGLRACPDDVRVVLSYSSAPIAGQQSTVKVIDDWFGQVSWVEKTKLEPFRAPSEEQMAYKHFLLHWYDENVEAPRPLALLESSKLKQGFLNILSDTIAGIPSILDSEAHTVVRAYLEVSKTVPLLRTADDEARLESIQGLSR